MTPAIVALQRAGIPHTLHEYQPQGGAAGYGAEAAAALGVAPQRVFKTLLVGSDGGQPRLAVACVPVDKQLDLRALAAASRVKKLDLAPAAEAERATGYVVGGISPLGQRKRLPMLVDDSALQFESVFISGGRRGLEIELSPMHLIALCEARTAAISRDR